MAAQQQQLKFSKATFMQNNIPNLILNLLILNGTF